MQVEIMISSPLTCGPHANLAEVAHLMWTGDCGIVPITDNAGKLIGVITDRDICIAASTQDKPPSQIHVDELPHADVHTCRADDDTLAALQVMREHRVRRLPVTGRDGRLQGILSINDLVVTTGGGSPVNARDVLETLQHICAHRASLEVPARTAKAGAAASPR